MMTSITRCAAAALAIAGLIAPMTGHTSDAELANWPTGNLRVIVPFPAGGTQDMLGRLVATELQAALGKSVVVENISGGATVPAAMALANAQPDGRTLLVASDNTLNINPHMFLKPAYHPDSDFVPVTVLNSFPHWLLTQSDSPFSNIAEFKTYIEQNPGKVSVSVNTVGGMAHLGVASWRQVNKLNFEIVPYRGSAPAVVDLLGGHTTAHVDTLGATIPHVEAGRLKPLALLQKEPNPKFPAIDTQDPQDPQSLSVQGNVTLVARAGTPQPILEKLHETIKAGAQKPDFQKRMDDLALPLVLIGPTEGKSFLQAETERYGTLFRASGLEKQ